MILPLRSERHLRRVPWMTLTLITVCVGLFSVSWFLVHLRFGMRTVPSSMYFWGWNELSPRAVLGASPFTREGWTAYSTLLSSTMFHGSWLHIGSNLVPLWCFGSLLEERMGSWRFLCFFVVVTLSCNLLFVLVFHDRAVASIGASGTIAGVMGAYLLKFPYTRVITLVWVIFRIWLIRVSALWIVGGWFLMQVYSWLSDQGMEAGVNWALHLLGFGLGMLWMGVFTGFRLESTRQERLALRWRGWRIWWTRGWYLLWGEVGLLVGFLSFVCVVGSGLYIGVFWYGLHQKRVYSSVKEYHRYLFQWFFTSLFVSVFV
ncbi:MAG: rhomboid family intramembrane serine protease, partial [Myxococcota bacterium]